MDRLISEFEVIRAIEKYVDNIFTKNMGDLIKDIKAIPSEEPKIVPIAEVKFDDDMLHEIVEETVKNIEIEPKWIPVSERLPDEWESVLVCFKSLGGIAQCVSARLINMDGSNRWLELSGYEPMAWMPLPKPYES